MIRSCRDPYYFQLVFEYLIHMNLPETATTFKRECDSKKYHFKIDEELLSTNTPASIVPKIVLYLPTALNADKKTTTEEIFRNNCNYSFSHGDTHEILINASQWTVKAGKLSSTKEISQQGLSSGAASENNNPQICSKSKTSIMSESIKLKSHPNKESNLNYTQLKTKFSKLHSDYHNLIGVASELTGALEMSARGQQIDLRETLNNCVQIYPELFSYEIHSQKNSKMGIKGRFSVKSKNCEWGLHIPRIKKHLQEENVKTRLLLLQALRWAITKSSDQERECIMNQYVGWDLLNLKDASFLKSLLAPLGVVTPHPLQQSVARLLNTIASIQSGRSYLAQNSETVNVTAAVLQQLDGISSDSTTQNMLLAALQKLSLRRNQRIAMIQAGMVEWLFQQFSNIDNDNESLYSVEYGTALLMNLCLHQSARELCIPMAQNVLTVLIGLLSTSVTQALAYINGTLYSLITHPKLNNAALAIGLQEALEYNIKKQSDAEIKKQMEHILQFHQTLLHCSNTTAASFAISDGEMIDEDDESLDLLGEELDESDPVRNIRGELSGNDLLKSCYTLSGQPTYENNGEATLSESDLSESHGSSLMFCTTTPHHLGQSIFEQTTGKVQNDMKKDVETVLDTHIMKNYWQHRKASIQNQQKTDGKQKYNQYSSSGTEASEEPHKSEGEMISSKEVLWHHNETTSNSSYKPLNFALEESKNAVPEISIHLVDSIENSINCSDVDEDSEDVQVASMIPVFHEQQTSDKSSSNTENGTNVSAFTSRPKIPRTPPH